MIDEISKSMEILLGPKKKELTPMDIIMKAGESTGFSGISVGDLVNVEKAEDGKIKKISKVDQAFQYVKYMDKSKGISREDMPQIHEDNLDDFLIHFASKVPLKKLKKKLSDIKPTQGEINENKILKKIRKKSQNWKERKYIISLDGYLLDGHHDWAQGLEMDPDAEVDVYRVGVPIDRLLDRTKRMKISSQRDISDKEIKKSEEALILSIKGGDSSLAKKVLRNKPKFTSAIVRAALIQQNLIAQV